MTNKCSESIIIVHKALEYDTEKFEMCFIFRSDKEHMIDVTIKEFKKSRDRQEQMAAKITDDYARRLLLFYAVECGGKYQLLYNKNLSRFSDLSEKEKGYQHNIKSILKAIGIEEKLEFPNFTSKLGEQVPCERYQEMWRYGVTCDNSRQMGEDVEKTLKKVLELLHADDISNRRGRI